MKKISSTVLPILLGFSLLMETLDSTVINTALPQMARDLIISPLILKITITSYLFSLAAFMPVSGYCANRFGAKRVFLVAMLIFTLGSSLCVIADSVTTLVIGRIIQGIGGSMMTPVGRLILLQHTPKAAFVGAFSLFTLFGQIGPALGPFVGGLLTTTLSWRWVFVINVPIGLCALLCIARWVPNSERQATAKLDVIGLLLFGLAAMLFVFGASWLSESSQNAWLSTLIILIGIGLLLMYWRHAKHCDAPSLAINCFSIRTFRIAVCGSFVIRMAIGALPFVLPLLLQTNFGMSALQSGLYMVPWGIALMAAKPLIKPSLRALGYQKALWINPIIIAALFLSFITLNSNSSGLHISALTFLSGLFCSFQFTAMNTLNFADITDQDRASATSVSSVCQQLAMAAGVCVGALLLRTGSHDNHHHISLDAFHHAFIGLSALSFLSLWQFRKLKANDGVNLLH